VQGGVVGIHSQQHICHKIQLICRHLQRGASLCRWRCGRVGFTAVGTLLVGPLCRLQHAVLTSWFPEVLNLPRRVHGCPAVSVQPLANKSGTLHLSSPLPPLLIGLTPPLAPRKALTDLDEVSGCKGGVGDELCVLWQVRAVSTRGSFTLGILLGRSLGGCRQSRSVVVSEFQFNSFCCYMSDSQAGRLCMQHCHRPLSPKYQASTVGTLHVDICA
jgi:hypothetical protein